MKISENNPEEAEQHGRDHSGLPHRTHQPEVQEEAGAIEADRLVCSQDELVALAMDVQDLNGGIFFQIFPQFGNIVRYPN